MLVVSIMYVKYIYLMLNKVFCYVEYSIRCYSVVFVLLDGGGGGVAMFFVVVLEGGLSMNGAFFHWVLFVFVVFIVCLLVVCYCF